MSDLFNLNQMEKTMIRSASEIINKLETRIARLERMAKSPLEGSEIELLGRVNKYLQEAQSQISQVQYTVERTDLDLNREVKIELKKILEARKQIESSRKRIVNLQGDLIQEETLSAIEGV